MNQMIGSLGERLVVPLDETQSVFRALAAPPLYRELVIGAEWSADELAEWIGGALHRHPPRARSFRLHPPLAWPAVSSLPAQNTLVDAVDHDYRGGMSVDTEGPSRGGPKNPESGHRGGADRESETIREDILQSVLHRLDKVDLHAAVSAIGSADEIAERMIESLPLAGPFDEEIGPFYDTVGLRKRFRLSRQAIDQRARRRDLLCLKTSDGHRLYPAFQFDRHGTGIPRLREVLTVWPAENDHGPWQAAAWLNAAGDDLDGMTPAEALRTDRVDDVLTLARQAGALWRR